MSTTTTETRSLGAGGRRLSAVGVGTWALGGPFNFNGRDAGWGEVDDAESIRALHMAIDAGVTLIDTAPTCMNWTLRAESSGRHWPRCQLRSGSRSRWPPSSASASMRADALAAALMFDRRSFGPSANLVCAGSGWTLWICISCTVVPRP